MSLNRPNIVITGFMGTGKTTVGREVAQRLGRNFYDFDQIIESKMKLSIQEIFEKYGEIFFRNIENQIASEFKDKTDSVIATGGGTLLFENNFSSLSQNGIIFCLLAKKDVLIKRLESAFGRPLLANGILRERVECLLKDRELLYQKLPNPIDASILSPPEIASRIIEIYNRKISNVDKK